MLTLAYVKMDSRKRLHFGLRNAIKKNPQLVQEGLPYDEKNTRKGHPLHRICDYVFSGKLTDEEAVGIGEILLEFGANVNGYELILKKDTPLIAASSLHADGVAILYINHHADIHHQGTHGGTALHWAAWCGRDRLVRRLIEEGADVNKKCIDFLSTPLFWAVKSFRDKNINIINLNVSDCYSKPVQIKIYQTGMGTLFTTLWIRVIFTCWIAENYISYCLRSQ